MWTIEELEKSLDKLNNRERFIMKTPPWTCPFCKEKKVDSFKFHDNYFYTATCSNCGKTLEVEI